MKKIINLILLLLFCNIIKLGAQTYAIPPNSQTTINGVNISSSLVGFVNQWSAALLHYFVINQNRNLYY